MQIYYLNNRSNITHTMINAKDILPLYRAMIRYRKSYDIVVPESVSRLHTYVLSILCYSILRARFRNRECFIYKKNTHEYIWSSRVIMKVVSGNVSIYFNIEGYSSTVPFSWTKICDRDSYMTPSNTYVGVITQYLPVEILEPGTDIKSLMGDQTFLAYNILAYKVDKLFNEILPKILCTGDRKDTIFSSIPDITMFR